MCKAKKNNLVYSSLIISEIKLNKMQKIEISEEKCI